MDAPYESQRAQSEARGRRAARMARQMRLTDKGIPIHPQTTNPAEGAVNDTALPFLASTKSVRPISAGRVE